MTDTPALLIYTTYRLVPDDLESFRALALRMSNTAKARDGCVFLDVAQDAGDPATFRLIEGWRDQAALDAHGASAEFQTVMKDAADLGIVGRAIDVYTIAEKKTIDLP
ncbi:MULTISPECIES: putative quinol monooxygenase [unclassified Sphingomonas]|uniref:putative quinol monooxygenase n=1 Tax=unclassified Sphingomonas TaxID=196159 RepID=UPI00226A632A|nr:MULTISPECIES: putative quinol monooxygenase [unclassified Sphingomonas]